MAEHPGGGRDGHLPRPHTPGPVPGAAASARRASRVPRGAVLMNPLVAAQRGCFHQAAGVCRCPVGRLLGGYGLNDFLTNSAQDQDDAPTLAVKALTYFC